MSNQEAKLEFYVEMAQNNPDRLLQVLSDKTVEPSELSYAAEAAGWTTLNEDKVVPYLIDLLDHKSPLVREGAVYGLSNFMSEIVADALTDVIRHDDNKDVVAAASEASVIDYLLDIRE